MVGAALSPFEPPLAPTPPSVPREPSRSAEAAPGRGPPGPARQGAGGGRGAGPVLPRPVPDAAPRTTSSERERCRWDVPGEGMGLAYVRALVRRCGGRIWCNSEVGVGSTFSFSVPNHVEEGGNDVQHAGGDNSIG